MRRRRRRLLAAAVAAGALAVAVGVLLGGAVGQRLGAGVSSSVPPGRAPPPPATPPGFVRVGDGAGRFSIALPAGWTRRDAREPDVALLATGGPAASVLARSVPLRFRVDAQNLTAMKVLTDGIVLSGQRVRLLAPERRIELGGLPGYVYRYSFRDGDSGRRGIHVHYFLFTRDTMITLVLQALPAGRFDRFAAVFARIAGSFRAGQRSPQ